MMVTKREDTPEDMGKTVVGQQMVSADDGRLSTDAHDENGMSRDEVFDQLADEDAVVTSGRGSRLPITDSDGGTSSSGYSAGVAGGSGAD